MQVSTSSPVSAAVAAPVASTAATTSTTSADSSGGVMDQLKQLASVLSDSSTASQMDKVNAYISIGRILNTTSADTWATFSQTDRNAINDVYTNSQTSQAIYAAGHAFSDKGMTFAGSTTVNGPGVMLNEFNNMSPLDQLMTYAGTFSPSQYTFDQAKQQLQKDADWGAQVLANANQPSGPAVTVTLSPTAQAALGSQASGASTSDPSSPTDSATQALKALTTPSSEMSGAEVALQMLQRASDAKAKAANDGKSSDANAQTDTETSTDAQKPYSAGSTLNTTA